VQRTNLKGTNEKGANVQGMIVLLARMGNTNSALGSGRPHLKWRECTSIRLNSIIWHKGNPNRELRNANNLQVPAHRIEIVKRMPICSFPTAWNTAPQEKENPAQHLFLKVLKENLISSIV